MVMIFLVKSTNSLKMPTPAGQMQGCKTHTLPPSCHSSLRCRLTSGCCNTSKALRNPIIHNTGNGSLCKVGIIICKLQCIVSSRQQEARSHSWIDVYTAQMAVGIGKAAEH